MKNLVFILVYVLSSSSLIGQDVWTLDKGHSKVGFTVTHHMISEIDGNFKVYEAKMTTAKDDFSDAVFEFSAETASINTENEPRDGHLKSEDIFDAEKFPTISFKSSSFTQIAGNRYKISGDLTMKAKTLPITLDLWMVGPVENERAKRYEIGIKATGKLSRKSFGVGEKLPVVSVSDEVELRLLGEFNKAF